MNPGHVQLTSEETEWLYAHLLNACRIMIRNGHGCDPQDRLHAIMDKIDRARFQDSVPVLVGNKMMEDAILKAVKKQGK